MRWLKEEERVRSEMYQIKQQRNTTSINNWQDLLLPKFVTLDTIQLLMSALNEAA